MANEQKTNNMLTIKCPECDICGEKRWARVKCRYCNFECCVQCFDTYLLTTPGDSKCMSCKAIYDMDTIYQLCGLRKKTYKEYGDFKLNQIIQREQSLFQETLVEIEREREQKKLDKYRHIASVSIDRAQEYMNKFQMTVLEVAKTDEAIAESMLSKVGMSLKYIRNLRTTKILEANEDVRKLLVGQTPEEKKEEMKKNTFIKNCSMPNCKGTLNNRWNCRLCETSHCSKCGEKKNQEVEEGGEAKGDVHVCDPNMVQSMEEIKKNSKPCPKCGVSIFKTEGCDQMFCIVCHTAFSWQTLQIETGRIHNPHYYEILRKNGNIRREEGDVRPCDELVYVHNYWDELVATRNFIPPAESDRLEETFRFVTELNELHNERRFVINNHTFLEIRKKYLLNQVKESQFKTSIKRRNTEITKNLERCQVLGVTKIALSEELKKLFLNENGERINIRRRGLGPEFLLKYTTFAKNVEAIIQNTNEILERLSAKYTTSAPHKKIFFIQGMYQVMGEEVLAKYLERINSRK